MNSIKQEINSVLPNPDVHGNYLGNIINAIFWFLGVIAVIVIVYSGIQFATSAGDAGKAQKAKNTLTWAIVGLVVAILAYAIVNFVIERIG